MAIVRDRHHLNLHLPLPEPSESRPRFPLPLPPASSVIGPNDIEKLKVLGHGNGGTVYKVRHKRTSAIYAMKVVRGESDPASRRQVRREMEILQRTESPYVVKYQGLLEKGIVGDVAILMEYMEGGSLETDMKRKGRLSEGEVAWVAFQVVRGLQYLHSHNIMHRDIKPSNLLVKVMGKGKGIMDMEVKIGDFGVSKGMWRSLSLSHSHSHSLSQDACNYNSYVGTCAYMSPERFDPDSHGNGNGNGNGNYDGYVGDIWSLGLTLFELYVGHFLFLFLPPGQTQTGPPSCAPSVSGIPPPSHSPPPLTSAPSYPPASPRIPLSAPPPLSSSPIPFSLFLLLLLLYLISS